MWCWRCAPHAGVGPHSVSDPAAEIFRLRRENDWLRMERDIQKNCGHLLGAPEMRFRLSRIIVASGRCASCAGR